MDERQAVNLWTIGPFPVVTPTSGLSPLAVTALKIGDLLSSPLVDVEGVSLLGGSLHRSQSSTSLTEYDTELFGGRGQEGSRSSFEAFPSSPGSRTPPFPFTSIPSHIASNSPHHLHHSHPHHYQQQEHYQQQQQLQQCHQSHHSFAGKKPAKVCGVCGDRARSYHFGGISCDSCKAFFRRSVQNEAYRNFQCPYKGRCDITIASRKCCQFCRFQKCNEIGMEKGWVMTEEERTQLLKSRLERKQRLLKAKSSLNTRSLEPTSITSTTSASSSSGLALTVKTTTIAATTTTTTTTRATTPLAATCANTETTGTGTASSPSSPSASSVHSDLSSEDITLIEELVNTYQHCVHQLEAFQSRQMVTRSYVLNLFFSVIKQFSYFSQKLSSFEALPILADRETLLRSSVLEMLFLRSAYAYDDRLKGWLLSHDHPRDFDEALVYFEEVRELVDDDLLLEKHKRFLKTMHQVVPDRDNVVYTILMAISLHCGDRKGLLDTSHIAQEQEKYLLLLQRYLRFRQPDNYKSAYARILLKLPDLREVAEYHQEFDMKLTEEETKEIQERLAQQSLIEMPPMPRWKFHENVSGGTKDK